MASMKFVLEREQGNELALRGLTAIPMQINPMIGRAKVNETSQTFQWQELRYAG